MYLHCQHTGNNTVFGYAIKVLLKCYLKIFIIICIPNMLYFGGSSLWHHPTGPCNRGHINIDTWIYTAIVLNGKWQTLLYHCCIWDQKGRLGCTISAALKVVKLTALSAREMRRWQSFRLLSLLIDGWCLNKLANILQMLFPPHLPGTNEFTSLVKWTIGTVKSPT